MKPEQEVRMRELLERDEVVESILAYIDQASLPPEQVVRGITNLLDLAYAAHIGATGLDARLGEIYREHFVKDGKAAHRSVVFALTEAQKKILKGAS